MALFKRPMIIYCDACKENIEYEEGDIVRSIKDGVPFITCPDCAKILFIPQKKETDENV